MSLGCHEGDERHIFLCASWLVTLLPARFHLECDIVSANSAIAACRSCWRIALHLISDAALRGLQTDSITWSAGCDFNGWIDEPGTCLYTGRRMTHYQGTLDFGHFFVDLGPGAQGNFVIGSSFIMLICQGPVLVKPTGAVLWDWMDKACVRMVRCCMRPARRLFGKCLKYNQVSRT